ncbi:hypothetical protein PILCRDRAFT_313045 [Piloderma croceum F 1598]|uniref:Uncharacterized protein n=1 Tax=Piloderma croceum (strain F 1598) TaxID=765440 RepID=A0A0C3G7R5_PILCF|nr:hypothetical protein PILCRDRAFT_313045 [Piloderma croceum F 1598]
MTIQHAGVLMIMKSTEREGRCLFQKALIRVVKFRLLIARTEHKKSDVLSACRLKTREILEI